MKQPHKHADVIKAWADGDTVQCRYKNRYGGYSEWEDNKYPSFYHSDDFEYRIKPEKTKVYVVVYKGISGKASSFSLTNRESILNFRQSILVQNIPCSEILETEIECE